MDGVRDNKTLTNKASVRVYACKKFVMIGKCDCCWKRAPIQCYIPLDPCCNDYTRTDKTIYLCNYCAVSGKLLSSEQVEILFDQKEYDKVCKFLNPSSEEEEE